MTKKEKFNLKIRNIDTLLISEESKTIWHQYYEEDDKENVINFIENYISKNKSKYRFYQIIENINFHTSICDYINKYPESLFIVPENFELNFDADLLLGLECHYYHNKPFVYHYVKYFNIDINKFAEIICFNKFIDWYSYKEVSKYHSKGDLEHREDVLYLFYNKCVNLEENYYKKFSRNQNGFERMLKSLFTTIEGY